MSSPSPSQQAFSGRDLAALLTVILIWGMNFVAIRQSLLDFTPFQLGAARFLLSMFPLMLWIRPPLIGAGWVLGYGLLQGVGQFGFLFFAFKAGMPTSLAPIVMQMQLFVTALLAALLLGERVGRSLKTGLVLACCGLGCFAVQALASAGAGGMTLAALVLNLLAAASWAGSNVLVRSLQMRGARYDPLALVVWSSVVSAVVFVVLALLFDPAPARWAWTGASLSSWLCVLYVSWGGNVLAYWIWASLLARFPANRVAPFSLGVPVIGVLAGILVYDERIGPLQGLGVLLVMGALLFVLRDGTRRGTQPAGR